MIKPNNWKQSKKTKVDIPNRLKEENQYSYCVQAMALTFMNEGNMSTDKTREMIEGFTFGVINPREGSGACS